jgi:hypothetical protein
MSTAHELYFALAQAANAQFLADKAVAEAKLAVTIDALMQAAGVESPNYAGNSISSQPGFPIGPDVDGEANFYAAFDQAMRAANAQKAADLLAAEGRRQGAIGVAADLLRTLGELP